uniref:Uncharacterized protein n=1 Tax=Lygus hesperus TaxID=30085 RepID=A0A0A9ZFN1_LYGHE
MATAGGVKSSNHANIALCSSHSSNSNSSGKIHKSHVTVVVASATTVGSNGTNSNNNNNNNSSSNNSSSGNTRSNSNSAKDHSNNSMCNVVNDLQDIVQRLKMDSDENVRRATQDACNEIVHAERLLQADSRHALQLFDADAAREKEEQVMLE